MAVVWDQKGIQILSLNLNVSPGPETVLTIHEREKIVTSLCRRFRGEVGTRKCIFSKQALRIADWKQDLNAFINT